MLIQITQEDITAGDPNDPCNCPAALAVGRAFDAHLVYVGEKFVDVHPKKEVISGTRYVIPQKLNDWISKYLKNPTLSTPIAFDL